ncbi:hypothetical protein ACVW17_002758 [Bradyrhizobium sp. USDA 4473]
MTDEDDQAKALARQRKIILVDMDPIYASLEHVTISTSASK